MQQVWGGQAKPVMGVGKAAPLPCSKGNMHELVNAVFLALWCRERQQQGAGVCNRPPTVDVAACAAVLDDEGTEAYRMMRNLQHTSLPLRRRAASQR